MRDCRLCTRRLWRALYRTPVGGRNYRYSDPLAGQTYKGEPLGAFKEALAYIGNDCLFWQFAKDSKGYGQIHNDGRVQYVHRAICEMVNGPAPTEFHEASHGCGNGHFGCVTQKHLRWATHTENMADKEVHGTLPLGEYHHRSLLTEDQVREIRSLRGHMTQRAIGEKFGVHKETVGSIQRRENWAWLD